MLVFLVIVTKIFQLQTIVILSAQLKFQSDQSLIPTKMYQKWRPFSQKPSCVVVNLVNTFS